MADHECPECGEPLPNDIWKDAQVRAALKQGRTPDDIFVLHCPKCGRLGYYNQGSSFWCRFCKEGWRCCSEGESTPEHEQYLDIDGLDFPISLADTVTVTTDGYDNETLPHRRQPPEGGVPGSLPSGGRR